MSHCIRQENKGGLAKWFPSNNSERDLPSTTYCLQQQGFRSGENPLLQATLICLPDGRLCDSMVQRSEQGVAGRGALEKHYSIVW
eukprot:2311370-Heterocapsa_arctica.AAC.1